MRILQVNNYHRILGGADAVFFNTAKILRADGHHVVTFSASGNGDLPSPYSRFFPSSLDMSTARLSDLIRYVHNRDAAKRLEELIDVEGPFDLAHLHIYYGQLTASILAVLKRNNIPIIQTLHEYKLACPVYTLERGGNICEKCVEGSSLNLLRHRCKGGSFVHSFVALAEFWASKLQGDVHEVSQFICVSDFQRGIMERAGVPQDKLATLHNFIDLDSLPLTKRSGRGNYLLYFGRIEKLKGIVTLMNAAKRGGITLKIAGTGAMSEYLENSVVSITNIEYFGYQTGAPLDRLVSNARAVIVPSEWYENCPMSVLEAKAAGIPVIGARIGGIPELVQDGVDGFLFEPGDANDLLRAISALDSADSIGMSQAARTDVKKRFSGEAHLERLLKIYATVLQNKLT